MLFYVGEYYSFTRNINLMYWVWVLNIAFTFLNTCLQVGFFKKILQFGMGTAYMVSFTLQVTEMELSIMNLYMYSVYVYRHIYMYIYLSVDINLQIDDTDG